MAFIVSCKIASQIQVHEDNTTADSVILGADDFSGMSMSMSLSMGYVVWCCLFRFHAYCKHMEGRVLLIITCAIITYILNRKAAVKQQMTLPPSRMSCILFGVIRISDMLRRLLLL